MRIPIKKLGLAGALLAGVTSLVGCGTTIPAPVQPIHPLAQAISDLNSSHIQESRVFSKKADEAAQIAKLDYVKALTAKRKKAMGHVKNARAQEEKLRKDMLALQAMYKATFPGYALPSTTSKTPTKTVPTNSGMEAYLLARTRIDGKDAGEAFGLGLTLKKNKKYASLQADFLKEIQRDLSHNLTMDSNGYSLAGGLYSSGSVAFNLGAGLRFEKNKVTGQNGITNVNDSQSEVRPFIQAGAQIGKKKFTRVQVEQYLSGGDRGLSAQVGWRF